MKKSHFGKRKFWSHFVAALTVCASVCTLFSVVVGTFKDQSLAKGIIDKVSNFSNCLAFIIILCALALIGILCSLYAKYQTKQKESIKIVIADNFKLTIKQGNLFNENGIIIIPVDQGLNTHVGDGIISPTSVHGKFITTYFEGRIDELDNKIQQSLDKQGIVGQDFPDSLISANAKRKKYELGTCVEILDGGNRYIWVVATEFVKKNHVSLNRKDYSKVIHDLFSFIEPRIGDESVYMPLIGAGNARLNCSPERILHYLVDYFGFSLSDKKFLGGVNIIIPSLKDIDLNRIEDIFE